MQQYDPGYDTWIDIKYIMYFDGQLHYLDKDRQSSSMPQQQKSAQTADPKSSTTSSPQQPLTQAQTQAHPQPSSAAAASPSSSMPKSQTVGGAAGDLHSMALKSAINNIGLLPKKFLRV